MGEAALKTGDKAVVGTAVAIAPPPHLAKGGIRAQSRGWVDEVDVRRNQLETALAPHVGERTNQIMRKRALHREAPLGDIHVPAIAIGGIRRQGARAIEKWSDRIREPGS